MNIYLRLKIYLNLSNFQRWDWLKSETDNKVEWPCNMSATK